MARGQLRLYLGAAPGVGKTYAMLNEGRRRRSRGTDVVVGFVETHGRVNTAAQIGDLELVPRRTLGYKDRSFDEMDVDAILQRRPTVALVDELAHTNVPGSRNEKRWQDVEEILAAGIDVITTLNVQHLESLNDVLEQITGVTQQETIPDEVVRRADQIELVDMTPEALRRRMAHGNVYAAEKVDAALRNYFRPGNLGALREIALLWVADRVDEFLDRYRADYGITRPWETRERVVVALTGAPGGDRLVRRAARIAERAHGELLGVHVRSHDGLATGRDAPGLSDQRALLEQLGGAFHEVAADDVPAGLLDFAAAENATQLVIGATRRSRWGELTRGSVVRKVLRALSSTDVHVIASEGDPEAGGARLHRKGRVRGGASVLPLRRTAAGIIVGALGLVALTFVLAQMRASVSLSTDMLMYLVLVVVVATIGGFWPAMGTALVGSICVNWYFTPPIHALTIAEAENALAIVVFLAVGGLVSLLVSVAERRRYRAERSGAVAETLVTLAAALLRQQDPIPELVTRVQVTFGQDGAALFSPQGADGEDEWVRDEAAGDRAPATPEAADLALALSGGSILALNGPPLPADDRRMLAAFAAQVSLALESRRLSAEADRAAGLAEANELRTALLAAVSHDLRTPLASIKAAASGLLQTDVTLPEAERNELLETIDGQTDRLTRLVGNLLDMSRIQSGTLDMHRGPVGIDEIVASAVQTLAPGDEARLVVDVDETLPRISVDAALVERSVANVVSNALQWAPAGSQVRIEGDGFGEQVQVRVVDHGPGIPPKQREFVLMPFQRLGDRADGGVGLGLAVARGFVELSSGEFELDDTPGGGLTVTMTFAAAP